MSDSTRVDAFVEQLAAYYEAGSAKQVIAAQNFMTAYPDLTFAVRVQVCNRTDLKSLAALLGWNGGIANSTQ
jgi:hypothetical protein